MDTEKKPTPKRRARRTGSKSEPKPEIDKVEASKTNLVEVVWGEGAPSTKRGKTQLMSVGNAYVLKMKGLLKEDA